ncbi:hypothetical protein [Methylobacterium nigriterrae]|uniref:hypothetical protein n=1 Tax=Methylobacterium nigriterrae TaxID=3127512 RepID=UPI003013C810
MNMRRIVAASNMMLGAVCTSALAQDDRAPGERDSAVERVSPDPDRLTTGSVGQVAPVSDQIRGPAHDGRTGAVRPGNPSPSVR